MTRLTAEERATIADALVAYAESVQENLEADLEVDRAELEFPVVEDFLADADRIRAGESPLHELTREVLADTTGGPGGLVDDPAAFAELVARLDAVEVSINQHGAVYVGGIANDNVVGWVRDGVGDCENEHCLEAIAAGRNWHAIPRRERLVGNPAGGMLAVYHYSTREAAVAVILEAVGVVTHAAECPVVEQRAALELALAGEPDNEYLAGARLEFYMGDQDGEACNCGAYDRLEALELVEVRT